MALKKYDEATRRWIADLVHAHGQRGAIREAEKQNRKISYAMADRCFREFYPGQSSDQLAPDAPAPGAPAKSDGSSSAAARPPPEAELDRELLEATDPEQVLLIAIKRAARFTASSDGSMAMRALERVERISERLVKLRADRAKQEAARRRSAILILPMEEDG